jgi:hypothetical protein
MRQTERLTDGAPAGTLRAIWPFCPPAVARSGPASTAAGRDVGQQIGNCTNDNPLAATVRKPKIEDCAFSFRRPRETTSLASADLVRSGTALGWSHDLNGDRLATNVDERGRQPRCHNTDQRERIVAGVAFLGTRP